jgi:hypothetical protein
MFYLFLILSFGVMVVDEYVHNPQFREKIKNIKE